ncbi:MAG: DUF4271 domain-containing protein [Bacteroidales bacterium]|nr:DUF4271 domain-containing protein [Bacteroidales bacterium]
MPATDTIAISTQPFYQWDTVPYVMATPAPDAGMAVADTFSLYFLPDSTMAAEPVVRPSLFREHSLDIRHEELQPRADVAAPVWVFGVLVALLALMTLYYRTCKLRFRTLLPLLFDSRAMDRTLRNNNLNSRIRFVPMGLLMLSCLMLAVHQTALAKTGFGCYLLLVAAVSGLYLLRNGLLRLLALIFDNRTAVDTYITSNYLYHLTLASLALPLLFLLAYLPAGQPVVLTVLEGVVVLEMIMRLFRGMKLFLTQSSGPYVYLFYYLCIVELAPFLVLIKWIIE